MGRAIGRPSARCDPRRPGGPGVACPEGFLHATTQLRSRCRANARGPNVSCPPRHSRQPAISTVAGHSKRQLGEHGARRLLDAGSIAMRDGCESSFGCTCLGAPWESSGWRGRRRAKAGSGTDALPRCLPLDGLEDAHPAVAPAPFGLPVADEAAVGGFGLTSEFELRLAQRLVGAPDTGLALPRAAPAASSSWRSFVRVRLGLPKA
jgi:hypothetical protein